MLKYTKNLRTIHEKKKIKKAICRTAAGARSQKDRRAVDFFFCGWYTLYLPLFTYFDGNGGGRSRARLVLTARPRALTTLQQ